MGKCEATTRRGRPCAGWAMRGGRLCSVHAGVARGGAPAGNQNAVKHGYYGRYFKVTEWLGAEDVGPVEAEVAVARAGLARVLRYMQELDEAGQVLSVDEFATLMTVLQNGTSLVGRLLRGGDGAEELGEEIAAVLGTLRRG